MSGLTPISFAFLVSTGVVFQFGVFSSTSDQLPNYLLVFAASLTFFLATTHLPFLLLPNSTIPLRPVSVRFINWLSFATMITYFITFPNFNNFQNWGVEWAISSGLICFAISLLCKLISKAQPGYRHCLHVAFLTLCVGFAGLYADSLLLPLPDASQFDSIIHIMTCIYHFALVPVTFVLGTVLVIFSMVPPVYLVPPFASVSIEEGMTVLTLAIGLTTLIIGSSLTVYAALVNFAMAGGFGIGWPREPNHVEAI